MPVRSIDLSLLLSRVLLLLVLALSLTPLAAQDDNTPNVDQIERIMNQMSLREKVAQLFMLPLTSTEFPPELGAFLAEYPVGGMVLFNQSSSRPGEVAALITDVQAQAIESGAGVPLFVAADQEGWPISRLRLDFTIFPNNMALAAANHGQYIDAIAHATAAEMLAVGFNMNLAPVADVNNNAANSVIDTRSFGSDPVLVGQMVARMVGGLQTQGLIATAKHFPGHGDTSVDSHEALPVVRKYRFQLEQTELVPFQAAIDAGVEVIMTAHVWYTALEQTPDYPATFSAPIITELLRDDMGFDGVVMSDSLLMGAVTQDYTFSEAAALAFQAGVDILAYGTNEPVTYTDFIEPIDHLVDLIERGEIAETRLNQSLRRVLTLKKQYGLLSWSPPDDSEERLRLVGTDFNDALVRSVAQQAVTLARDEALLLPLEPAAPVVMVYPQDIAPWLAEAARARDPDVVLVPVSFTPGPAQIATARQYDDTGQVVVFTCEARRQPAQVDLVDAFDPEGVIVVALCSPYDLLAFPNVSTYLASYWELPLAVSGVMAVLYGEVKPGGRLPVAMLSYPVTHGLSDFPGAPVAPATATPTPAP